MSDVIKSSKNRTCNQFRKLEIEIFKDQQVRKSKWKPKIKMGKKIYADQDDFQNEFQIRNFLEDTIL